MQQLIAILKDSFREAVDGFVIYAMLVLSALLIVATASLSFTPTEPDKAFRAIVQQFQVIVPDKGNSRAIMFSSGVNYTADDIQKAGDGYKLRLTVTGDTESATDTHTGDKKDAKEVKEVKGDSFRAAVARWSAVTGETVKIDEKGKMRKGRGRGVEVAAPGAVSIADQRAVTDTQMEEFIKGQFLMHADMNSTVKRVPTSTEPTYTFDVTTSGGSAVKGWPHKTKVLFGAFTLNEEGSLGATLWLIEDIIINRFGGTFTLLVGIIITSFFIPNMLRKGSVDLLISKPISRSVLLVFKYIGGLTFMFLVTVFTVGGIWLVLAVRSGYWSPAFLAAIPILTFTFAILYALSTLVATFTRSAIAAMLMTVGLAFFLFVFGQVKATYDENRAENPNESRPEWQATVVDGGNDILPRYRDLDQLLRQLISDGTLTPAMQRLLIQKPENPPSPVGIFGVSLLHIAWMLGLSCWWFSKRDY